MSKILFLLLVGMMWYVILPFSFSLADEPLYPHFLLDKPQFTLKDWESSSWIEPKLSHLFDVLHYQLDLKFDLINLTMEGVVTTQNESKVDSLSGITLDLVNSLIVDSVKVNGVMIGRISHVNNELEIIFNPPFARGDTFEVEIAYHGYPANDGSGGFFFDPKVTYSVGVTVENMPPSASQYWFPCYDKPDDKATANLNITIPIGNIVASNGILAGVDTIPNLPDTLLTYHWSETHQIATYLICVAISPYATFSDYYNGMEVKYFVYPEDSAKAEISFQNVVEMIECFVSLFVPYPFSKYGIAEAPVFGGWGAMEHQTCTTYGNRLITGDNRYDRIVAHELSHMWWGDMITCGEWKDVWLNEGFATYCEALWKEYKEGDAAYRNYMEWLATPYFLEDSGHRFPIYDPQTPEEMWSYTIYHKGAWVLHMLRYVLGDSTFFDTMRAYADSFGYGNAITSDFQRICERVSGNSLDWFFEEWIYMAGYPEYEWTWNVVREKSNNSKIEVTIRQVQELVNNTPVFKMPIELTVYTSAAETTFVVLVDDTLETFTLQIAGAPDSIKFDKDRWVLKKVQFIPGVSENPSPPWESHSFSLYPCYPNPMSTQTRVRFSLPQNCHINLSIYNLLGEKVKNLLEGEKKAGYYEILWEGKNRERKKVAPGIYFCRLKAGEVTRTQRMVVLN